MLRKIYLTLSLVIVVFAISSHTTYADSSIYDTFIQKVSSVVNKNSIIKPKPPVESINLTSNINTQVEDRAKQSDPKNGLNVYVNRPEEGDVKFLPRNKNLWVNKGTPLNFTGVAGWQSDIKGHMNSPYRGGVTLITPRHFVTAKHFFIPIGTTVKFFDSNGNAVERKVVDSVNLQEDNDINIGILDRDVDSSIASYNLIDSNTLNDYLDRDCSGYGKIPVLVFNQFGQIIARSITNIKGDIYHTKYSTGAISNFSKDVVAGDSGQPGFLIINNKPVLLFVNHKSVNSSNIGDYIDEVNQGIIFLDEKYNNPTNYRVNLLNVSNFKKANQPFCPVPNITGISVNKVKTGEVIEVTGEYFDGVEYTSINFDGAKSSPVIPSPEQGTVITSNKISFKVPNVEPGAYRISVIGPNGFSNEKILEVIDSKVVEKNRIYNVRITPSDKNLIKGKQYSISWEQTTPGPVGILLRENNGRTVVEPLSPIERSINSFNWTVPVTLGDHKDAYFEVFQTQTKAEDGKLTNIAINAKSDTFSISTPQLETVIKDSVKLITPNGGLNIEYNQDKQLQFSWTSTANDTYSLYVRNESTKYLTMVASNLDPQILKYSWSIPRTLVSGNYKAILKTNSGAVDESDNTFKILGPQAYILNIYPSVVEIGEGVSINGNNFIGVTYTDVDLALDGGSFTAPANAVITPTKISFNIQNIKLGTYTVSMIGENGFSNKATMTVENIKSLIARVEGGSKGNDLSNLQTYFVERGYMQPRSALGVSNIGLYGQDTVYAIAKYKNPNIEPLKTVLPVVIKSPAPSVTLSPSATPVYTQPTPTYSPSYSSVPKPVYTPTYTPVQTTQVQSVSPSSSATPTVSVSATPTASPSPSSTSSSSPSPSTTASPSSSASLPVFRATLWDAIKNLFGF